jgi:hypothetical protein
MNIYTKFDFGDRVYHIGRARKMVQSNCPVCKADGEILLPKADGEQKLYICPECHGRKVNIEYLPLAWAITQVGMIGNIRVELYPNQSRYYKDERKYMLVETGINSGTLYDEKDLFGTEQEALYECTKRNSNDIQEK